MSSILILILGQIAFAQEPTFEGSHNKKAADSFNELSDISRNISGVLETATRKGDMERVQCIKARQTSISALGLSVADSHALSQQQLSDIMRKFIHRPAANSWRMPAFNRTASGKGF